MSDNKNPKAQKHDYQYSYNYQYKYNYNLGDMIDNAVEAGSKFGSSVLGSIAEALEQAGMPWAQSSPIPSSPGSAAWNANGKTRASQQAWC